MYFAWRFWSLVRRRRAEETEAGERWSSSSPCSVVVVCSRKNTQRYVPFTAVRCFVVPANTGIDTPPYNNTLIYRCTPGPPFENWSLYFSNTLLVQCHSRQTGPAISAVLPSQRLKKKSGVDSRGSWPQPSWQMAKKPFFTQRQKEEHEVNTRKRRTICKKMTKQTEPTPNRADSSPWATRPHRSSSDAT